MYQVFLTPSRSEYSAFQKCVIRKLQYTSLPSGFDTSKSVMKRPKHRSDLSKTVNLLKAATFAWHTCLKPFYWGSFIGQTVIESC